MRSFLRRLFRRLRPRKGGEILEVWVSTERPSDALFDAIARRFRDRRGIKEW